MAHKQSTSLNAKACIFICHLWFLLSLPPPSPHCGSSSADKGRHAFPSNGSPQVFAGNPCPRTRNLHMIILRKVEPSVLLCHVAYSYTIARCTVSRQSILRFGKICLWQSIVYTLNSHCMCSPLTWLVNYKFISHENRISNVRTERVRLVDHLIDSHMRLLGLSVEM